MLCTLVSGCGLSICLGNEFVYVATGLWMEHLILELFSGCWVWVIPSKCKCFIWTTWPPLSTYFLSVWTPILHDWMVVHWCCLGLCDLCVFFVCYPHYGHPYVDALSSSNAPNVCAAPKHVLLVFLCLRFCKCIGVLSYFWKAFCRTSVEKQGSSPQPDGLSLKLQEKMQIQDEAPADAAF